MVNSHLVKDRYCCLCVKNPCLVKLRLGETAALVVSVVIFQLISIAVGYYFLVKINEVCGKFSEGDRHFMDKIELVDHIWCFQIFF